MNYNIGDIITGSVSGVKPYGVFIKLEDTFGFCHISNCSHKFIKNLNETFPIGSEVKAKILQIDCEFNKINLSIKDCEIQKPQTKQSQFIQKSKFEKSNNVKKQNQNENIKTKSYDSFDDMLKNYLKTSEERLDCIGKRNQKYNKR